MLGEVNRTARYTKHEVSLELDLLGGDLYVDVDDDEKQNARNIAVGAISTFVLGQVVGLWVVFTRQNSMTHMLFIEHRYDIPAIFVLLVICTDLLYYKVATSDPGRLPRCVDEADTQVAQITSNYPDELREMQWCKYCKMIKLLRAKHCHQCGQCVAKYDHHCYWIHNCVGANNHCLFWWLLVMILISMTWGNMLVWASYVPNTRLRPEGGRNIMPTVASLLGIPMWMFVFVVFMCHTVLAVFNSTTWECVKRHKIPYLKSLPNEANPWDKGVWTNLKTFCCATTTDWRLPPEYQTFWV